LDSLLAQELIKFLDILMLLLLEFAHSLRKRENIGETGAMETNVSINIRRSRFLDQNARTRGEIAIGFFGVIKKDSSRSPLIKVTSGTS